MKNKRVNLERIYNIVSEISEFELENETGRENLKRKLIQAIALNCSLTLNFLNDVYSSLCEIRKLIHSSDIEEAVKRLDILAYQILEIRNQL